MTSPRAPGFGGKLLWVVGLAPSLSSSYKFSAFGLLASCRVARLETSLLLSCGFLKLLLSEAETLGQALLDA